MAAHGGFFGYSEETLCNLYSKVICRKTEIDALLTLFGDRDSFSCPAIFVCGHTATGKSVVVQTLLRDLEVREHLFAVHFNLMLIKSFYSRLFISF